MNRSFLVGGLEEVRLRAGFDHVTGLNDRNYFNETLTSVWTSADDVQPLSMLLLDIDHFMGFNRAYGPIEGDDCLNEIGRAVKALSPRGATVARLDADEFAVLMPRVPLALARSLGANLISTIGGLQIPNSRSHLGVVTASVGVATACTNYDFMWGPQTLTANAREALDSARFSGGNRIEVHGNVATNLGAASTAQFGTPEHALNVA